MPTIAQILDQVSTAASCEDLEDISFAIWKLNKLAKESSLEISGIKQLAKRRDSLHTKLLKSTKKPDILKAVQLMCSECYGALKIANSIAGEKTPAWQLLHLFTRKDIFTEVARRKLDISNLTTAVGPDGELVTSTPSYKNFAA